MLTAGGWLGGVNFGGDEAAATGAGVAAERVRRGGVLRSAGVAEGEAFPGAAALIKASG